jgi:hypothetical protein
MQKEDTKAETLTCRASPRGAGVRSPGNTENVPCYLTAVSEDEGRVTVELPALLFRILKLPDSSLCFKICYPGRVYAFFFSVTPAYKSEEKIAALSQKTKR